MATVGMIGIGSMGGAMARRLLEAGHDVVVHDTRRESADPLLARGARWAGSPRATAEQCRTVFTSLPGPADVEAVVTGDAGLLAGARSGDVHVGHSTVSVESARRTAERCREAGVCFLDAPVSGGPMGVEAGTLAVLASGDPHALEVARPILAAFAGRVFDLGREPGTATLAKLVNNAIFLCSGLVHQEAVVLAAKAGMDPAVLDDVLGASSAALYLALAKPTLSRDWDHSGFSVALAEKDVALALESARAWSVPMPVVAAAHQHYVRALAAGLGDKVCFATLAAVEAAAGVVVPARPAD
jgi:3-hydroxyisobutyrate dehydrogenase-like beta-hydroxyacid dehydrogenase